MKTLNYTYVDNSNVAIEGKRVSAVKKGMAKNIREAMMQGIVDQAWELEYGALHSLVCGDRSEVGAARLWGSPPPGDSFWKMVEKKGFKVKTYERGFDGKEKKVDVGVAHAMTKDAYTILNGRQKDVEITLVAGDKDYAPVIEDLKGEGFRVIVAFWGQAAPEIQKLATEFFCLDPYLDALTYKR